MAGEIVPAGERPEASSLPVPGVQASPGGYPAAPPLDDEQGIQWGRYIAALQRYRWLILGITILGSALAVFATRFIKPQYTASATIWIEPQRREGAAPIRAEQLLEQTYAWVELLRTPVVLDSAALRMKLYLEPKEAKDSALFRDFTLANRFYPGAYTLAVARDGRGWALRRRGGGLAPERGAVGDSVGRRFGFTWLPPRERLGKDREIEFTVRHPRDASTRLASSLVTMTATD